MFILNFETEHCKLCAFLKTDNIPKLFFYTNFFFAYFKCKGVIIHSHIKLMIVD